MKGNYADATKIVNLFRLRFFTLSSSHHSSLSRFSTTNCCKKLKFGSVRALLQLSPSPRAFVFQSPLNVAANYLRNFRLSGNYMCIGSILAVPIVHRLTTAHAMDAGDALVDDPKDSQGLSEEEENVHQLWKLARKFWLPVLFFMVLANSEGPFAILFIKVTLFFLSTKPSPFSVYIFVDQLCRQFMRQETQFLQAKPLYASKVEVQDYKLLCLASVEVRNQKFTLVGIFGTWWTLPHLPSWETFSFVRNRLGSILLKPTSSISVLN